MMSCRSESWFKLTQTISGIEANLSRYLSSHHGIGLTEYRALHFLSESPSRELRMQDLAIRLQLNQSSVTRLVERLEKLGLTTRTICLLDKRGVETVLTDKGGRLVAEAQPDYERQLSAALVSYDFRPFFEDLTRSPNKACEV